MLENDLYRISAFTPAQILLTVGTAHTRREALVTDLEKGNKLFRTLKKKTFSSGHQQHLAAGLEQHPWCDAAVGWCYMKEEDQN